MEVFYKYEKNITINWADLRTFNDIGRLRILVYRLVSVSIVMMYSIVLFAQQRPISQHVDNRLLVNQIPIVANDLVLTDISKYQRISMSQVPVISSSFAHSLFGASSMDLGFSFMDDCISLVKKISKCADFSYLRSLSSVASELKENIGFQELTNNEMRSGDASEVFSDVEEIDDNPIFVPEAFSPNGDGINDVFMPAMNLRVYDRNGIMLYIGSEGWDGTYNGQFVDPDTYFYIVTYADKAQQVMTLKGSITVVK